MTPLSLSGRTRVIPIIGDPIVQVRSPAGVTAALNARGRDAVVVPMHVMSQDVDAFLRGVSLARNVDGVIATVPHKFASYPHCSTATERAHFLRAVNVLRRNPDRSWHGDALDGEAFVRAIRREGWQPSGPALLVGAGGAGSAVGLALLTAGVPLLAIHDADPRRSDYLIARLSDLYPGRVREGSDDPTGFALVANATPAGMHPDDALPVDVDRLDASTFVGDLVTSPPLTPLVAAARARGCRTQTGIAVFEDVLELMIDFLLDGCTDDHP